MEDCMYTTDQYEGMLAETVVLPGHHADLINAYFARPLGQGPFPGMVLIHHLPGWDEWYRETTRKFAARGDVTLSPYLYARRTPGFSAIVDCWGGRVVMTPEELTPKQPVAPVDYTADLSCPVLGIFGNDDQSPTPDQVNQLA